MSTISKINGIAIGSIAKISGIAKASITKVDGISISAAAWVSPTAIHSKCGEEFAYPASNLIDGDLSTRWGHATDHEHWVIFDLGSSKSVKKIRLHLVSYTNHEVCAVSAVYINDTADESGGSKGSAIFVREVGKKWEEVNVTDTTGRYIKIKLKTYDADIVCGIIQGLMDFYEFQAYV